MLVSGGVCVYREGWAPLEGVSCGDVPAFPLHNPFGESGPLPAQPQYFQVIHLERS